MMVWKDPESGAWRVETAEGVFTLREDDGGLGVNGAGPTNAVSHHMAVVVHPRSGNDVVIHYERRDQ